MSNAQKFLSFFAGKCQKSLALQNVFYQIDGNANPINLHRPGVRQLCASHASKCLMHFSIQDKVEMDAVKKQTNRNGHAISRLWRTGSANSVWTCQWLIITCRHRLQEAEKLSHLKCCSTPESIPTHMSLGVQMKCVQCGMWARKSQSIRQRSAISFSQSVDVACGDFVNYEL